LTLPEFIAKPVNQILAQGDPLITEMKVGANATTAKMLPGNIVIIDTVAGEVKEAGAKAQGWVGLLEVAPNKLLTDLYVVGDRCKVIEGDCYAQVRLKASENVSLGDKLVTAADGQVAKQAVGAMGAQGRVIGEAMEASNVTTIAFILIHWRPSHESAAAS
jgi:hypothetical protein